MLSCPFYYRGSFSKYLGLKKNKNRVLENITRGLFSTIQLHNGSRKMALERNPPRGGLINIRSPCIKCPTWANHPKIWRSKWITPFGTIILLGIISSGYGKSYFLQYKQQLQQYFTFFPICNWGWILVHFPECWGYKATFIYFWILIKILGTMIEKQLCG